MPDRRVQDLIRSTTMGFIIACFSIGLIGCRSVQASMLSIVDDPESPPTPHVTNVDEGSSSEISRWPTRWGNNANKRGVIIDLDRPWRMFRPAHLGRYANMRSSEIEYADAAVLAGALGMDEGFRFKPEGPGSFVFVPRVEPNDEPDEKPEPAMAFKFVSAQPIHENLVLSSAESDEETPRYNINPESGNEDHVRLQRTWFTFRRPQTRATPIGTIVILPGMFGTPEPVVDGTEAYFLSQGWAVLRMMSHPSDFTGYQRFEITTSNVELMAYVIAKMYDERTAECAYAAEAALSYVLESNPALTDQPKVLMGMSGGAMVLPTVYAFDKDRYDAAILVAGGANSMLITAMSNYKEMIDAVRLDFDPSTPDIDGTPTREQLMTLSDTYLARSKLDAMHTAHEMREIPVLMLHASRDKAVPSKRGEDLYEALGKPERWSYPVGHELIFAALPMQMSKIHDWIQESLDLESE